ncbi:RNA methyltransferase [Aeromicrobium phragmitis]|uniref:RNA methyltransferase n=1 Tax=Aeromicrobium phragmitis TaxID=2478914 RepID=A0A3L8PKX7_9ACTN|nr:RNA methyltransferase [Aeromicrobium phragmitis]RLV54712.1 RNA methyltransferase [Aeromicrobium phragmitis]
MAEMIRVDDPRDPRLRDYVDLRDVSLRKLLESERGLYIAEGEKVVRRAVTAGHRPRSFLLAPRWAETLQDVLVDSDAPCFVLDEKAIEQVTGFHVHRGALAAMERPEPRSPGSVLEQARRVVVAEDLVDHTNIGALMRNVAALGFDAVLLSPRCADPLYRRSVKVAMGAVFSLPYARIEDWYAAPELLRSHGFTSYAMTLTDDAVPLDDVHPEPGEKIALIVGSEGPGLTEHWQRAADHRVTIPMAAGIDSLNVAASTAVACWHLRP